MISETIYALPINIINVAIVSFSFFFLGRTCKLYNHSKSMITVLFFMLSISMVIWSAAALFRSFYSYYILGVNVNDVLNMGAFWDRSAVVVVCVIVNMIFKRIRRIHTFTR